LSLDEQYNPRLSVANVEKYFVSWQKESLAAKKAIQKFKLDLAFGSSLGQRLDVFYGDTKSLPIETTSSLPTLVFIHGGYWRALDKADFSFIAQAYTAGGVNVVITNYDLCPTVTLREVCLQQAHALAWIYRNSAALRLNNDKLVVSGHSAGGHLSALLLTAMWPVMGQDLPVDLVKGAILLSGLFDLRPVSKAPFLAKDLLLKESEAIMLSPAFMAPATDAPFLTAVGELESDAFHAQTSLIETRWKRNFRGRVPALSANHFSICDRFATVGDPLFEKSLELIKSI
jgi:arylformamidase